ncbi:pentatricopeptide repeat-containing protein At1g14470-like isoform X1 [Dioscorea cayenensis subsp. rotundata]|uniref:Pentatricopeptide repeat-containing protein At1g14470-like isoform X1 n=2 Tax=Dioscorea cayennensis subsp. rotundata TaxID=55577 RepID=A0AB40B235_DIOCR|nr:pentatricopeptide repeat-containing protein At1g14470-like isoform X1 [Dioscorea cayenensis subsp. rotundata]
MPQPTTTQAHGNAVQLPGSFPDASAFPQLIKSLGCHAVTVHAHVLKLGLMSDRYIRNSVLCYYAKYGPFLCALSLFDEMPDRGIVDWNSMLSGFWKWSSKEDACKVFDEMPERNVVSWTVMVSGLARAGELEEARRVFELMPERSVVSWNAVLSGYVKNGLPDECLFLFNKMMNSGVRPNETSWVTVISACASKGDLQLARTLVQQLEESRVNLNFYVKTALIDMYAKCGCLEKASEMFATMKDRNSVTWNAMISAYIRGGDVQSARKLFNRMHAKDVISWNTMISGYVQHGQWTRAIELFKEISLLNNMKPDEFTMSSVIAACGHLGIIEFGRSLVDYIAENRIPLSLSGYNSLIFFYSRCGSLEEAKKIFEEMPERDVFSYNSLISGLAANGNGYEVLKLLKKMKNDGIEPDAITYIGTLTALSHSGQLDEGFRVFAMIKTLTVDHYACMVDLLGRAGRLDEVMSLISEMPVKPHSGVYGALLNASRIHKRVDLGEFAAKELFELEPENSGNYILLSNMYASNRRWEEVEKLRKMMREKGVLKTVGSSWLEFSRENSSVCLWRSITLPIG